MKGLEGRKALVSGGASGIGRATAVRFAQLGADVAILDTNATMARETVEMVKAAGRRGLYLSADVTDFTQVKNSVATMLAEFGQIDALASLVGWNEHSFFMQQEPDFWHKVVDINFWGQIHVVRAVLDHMIARRQGAIVTVGSDAGRIGTNGETIYAAAKGGVIAFSKSLAREVTRFGVRINCVCPGVTDTPMFQTVAEHQPKILDAIVNLIPMKRIARPEEPAETIVFLASESASYITGQTLSVNGGLNML
ncbi:MAG: SDR family oxidoreductase [Rhodospirillales bacterium]|nr:SDR family oxidoreductase [Rhodospirillales bacterium]